MSWRYQPVYVDHTIGDITQRAFSLCEVYFDKNGKLESWTERPAMTPAGVDDVQDLRGDLVHMLSDSYKWKPVAFSDLKAGMTFERFATHDQMEQIATMIESFSSAAEAARKELN